MKKRKFSQEQKLKMLKESGVSNAIEVCRKYSVAPSFFNKWKKQFDASGVDSLKAQYKTVDLELTRLEQENERLKLIVAKQALEIEVKSELLKKSCSKQEKLAVIKQFEGTINTRTLLKWMGIATVEPSTF